MLKQVFQILSIVKIEQAIRFIILTTMLLCHTFMHNYMGEKVTTKSSNVCEKVWVIYVYLISISFFHANFLVLRWKYKLKRKENNLGQIKNLLLCKKSVCYEFISTIIYL